MAAFARADAACVFGPSFFLRYLEQFVRDRCPSPGEHLPLVQVQLTNGDTLDVCHIVGVAPRWVMLATWRSESHHDEMAIRLVPYEIIQQVHLRAHRSADGATAGFQQIHTPSVVDVHALLDALTPRSSATAA